MSAKADPTIDRRPHARRSVARALAIRAGLAIAFVLLAAGSLIHAVEGGGAHVARYGSLLATPSLGDQVLMLGFLVLAATPAFQVLALVISWLRVRDYRFAFVAALVVAMLAVGALLGMTR